MQFIEALKLRSKLLFLFILITVGLISVGIMGTSYINAMKKNIDSLYFGSLVPVTELNDILQTYHNDLAATIYKASREEISPQESIARLQRGLKTIDKRWKSYASHYKSPDEIDYVQYTALEIQKTNRYFQRVLKAIQNTKWKRST